ncbi:MAG: hypothetical protein CUN53_02855 [Phototrophicales bacterium]|nr:MAG: hypothetical protein CUN53_02855 [Phototrophicales bacterium]
MLKRGLLGFILVCLLALTVSPAAAVPVADLTALAYSLPGMQSLAYASGLGFLPLIDALESQLGSDADTVRTLLTLLSSSSGTTVYTDTSGLVRLVITLPE